MKGHHLRSFLEKRQFAPAPDDECHIGASLNEIDIFRDLYRVKGLSGIFKEDLIALIFYIVNDYLFPPCIVYLKVRIRGGYTPA